MSRLDADPAVALHDLGNVDMQVETEPTIAPLERFIAPPHLDGSAGTHRSRDRCTIDVDDDAAAVRFWVASSDKEMTARHRRAAMDKLLNWACFERGKALSSLDEGDFASFARFLANPEPMHRWIGFRQPRESAAWRPFIKPLVGTSRAAVLKHTSALVSWLSAIRYADLRFLYGTDAMRDGTATVMVRGAERPKAPREMITVPEWHWIRRAMDRHFPVHDVASQRFILELLYYGNLHVEEVANLEIRHFDPPNRLTPGWAIKVPERPAWRGGQVIFAPPPLSDTIGRWMKQREMPRDGFLTFRIRDQPDLLLELNGQQIANQARQVLRLAASLALDSGDLQNGLPLRERSVLSLRGAFEEHQRTRPVDYGAVELTGNNVKFGLDGRYRRRPCWDWSAAKHLWAQEPVDGSNSP